MILASACLSVISAGIQLYYSYERGKSVLLDEFTIVERSFEKGLEAALWHFNFDQIDLLLDGIEAQQGVTMLRLSTPAGEEFVRGDQTDSSLFFEEFPLIFENDRSPMGVGTLTVGISLQTLNQDISDQFFVLVASNFAKTVLASLFMLLIFDWLVSRHLRRIAEHIGDGGWLTRGEKLELARADTGERDEISSIVTELENARAEVISGQSALVQQAENLKHLNEQLHDANREQAEFTYAISHDLKSPNNTVMMLMQELETLEASGLSENGRGIIQDAARTSRRMGNLIEDVLGYARTIEQELDFGPVDMNDLIAQIVEDLKGDITTAKAQINAEDLPVIQGNFRQLQILFQNLISNAIKFASPARSPVVTIGPAEMAAHEVAIPVMDNGVGIDPSYHDRIFSLFQRLQTYDDVPGSGLGLTLCKRIASNHGGRIKVQSEIDRGSTFTLVVPR